MDEKTEKKPKGILKKKTKRYFDEAGETKETDNKKRKHYSDEGDVSKGAESKKKKKHLSDEARASKESPKKGIQGSHSEAGKDETETFTVGNPNISQRRLLKWKKRRMGKDKDTDSSHSNFKSRNKNADSLGSRSQRFKDVTPFQCEEDAGYLKYNGDEAFDDRLSQTQIVEAVDVTSATKHFELTLNDFGPYHMDYNRSGRHLLLGGNRGHMAALDWQTKKLHCEFNAMETVNCVKWLHQETLFSVAQRTGVYVYDNQGVEIHVLQDLDAVLKMEFLPYHMLLVTGNEKGFLGYTDVSMGTRVASICTGLGRLDVMTQNSQNAVILLGHAAGTVTLWTPNSKRSVMKMLCHKAPVRAITVDSSGNYMATAGVDKRLKVFDLRTCKPLSSTTLSMGASSLDFSQRGLLAASLGTRVQVYRDARRKAPVVTPYLSHICSGSVQQLQFCPFEDVLGVGHQRGFSSLLVPGSGEASIDAMEVNPYATKQQRQNAEVKLLLDKIQPEMIGLSNWVKELSSKSAPAQKQPQQATKNLGKKEKEQAAREVKRASLKKATKEPEEHDPTDVLARFKKR